MIFGCINKWIHRFHYRCILPLSLICFFLVTGCSSLSSTNYKSGQTTNPISDPAKKVGIAMVKNKTSFKDRSYEKVFQQYLIDSISDSCSAMILVKPGDANYPDFLVNPPLKDTESIDNLGLVQLGRQAGMNAIVIGEIIGITGKEEKRGIIFFKDLHQFIYFQLKIDVYDTETGVKLIDEGYSEAIEVDELELELYKKKEVVSLSEVDDIFLKISEDIGEKICRAVNNAPWQGYITSITENHIVISSGKEVGLVPGALLEVFAPGKTIEGVGGHRFRMPGHKTGEVKLSAVYADSCEAVLYSGSHLVEGGSVKIKK